jgi:hypothetical protein
VTVLSIITRIHRSLGWAVRATWIVVAICLSSASAPVHADDSGTSGTGNDPRNTTARAAIRKIIEKETATTGLPPDVAEAVLFVESGFDSTVVGGVGEIGLMQVRPGTAAMLGFRGSAAELATPDINIHYGVLYLSGAWRLAGGDLCRALMKYRAGHGEETMTERSRMYCNRARNRLLAMNSDLAWKDRAADIPPVVAPSSPAEPVPRSQASIPAEDVYAGHRRGTAEASRAFWAAHEARIRLIKARIEAKWKRVASREQALSE